MSAAATAPGYWRTRRSLRDFPSNPSRPSSTYSSSRRTSIKDGDHRSMAVAETAERTARGRTSRRQRFVVASVGAGLRRFWPARGARRERGDVAARIGDFVSGGFRREGMGTPEIGDRPAQLTASRPVPPNRPLFRRHFPGVLASDRTRGGRLSVIRHPERNRPGSNPEGSDPSNQNVLTRNGVGASAVR